MVYIKLIYLFNGTKFDRSRIFGFNNLQLNTFCAFSSGMLNHSEPQCLGSQNCEHVPHSSIMK